MTAWIGASALVVATLGEEVISSPAYTGERLV